MRILVVGASGLIGAHVADALRERGHEVTTAARTVRAGVDRALDVVEADVDKMRSVLAGHDGVVFATRTEEQRPLPKPIYPVFRRNMVEPVVRLFTAGRSEGLTRGVLLGSYYTYFDRLHPEWRLAERSTYVRCRVEQAREGRAAAGAGLPIAVLELPFVVGRSGERMPNWAGPLESWARSGWPLVAPAGGTAMTSAQRVALAAVDALEAGSNEDIPMADENLTYAEMIERIAGAVGRSRRVRRLPSALVRTSLRAGSALQRLSGRESGVDPAQFGDLLLTDLFVDPPTSHSLADAFRESFPSHQ
ncbi:NAD-dependent epimerase/dehydratase family protein [Actinoplanes subtropicus]|uniref:NAD-dependent epimerase/dehydratase family protein n=1 Tax=Actinoplanes subtropicus TaxID=543632 RepID=UPI0004C4384D|nr:NAD(P)H-binding protein [Actinoplanes subtropicus]